jgi:hypothetical protein
MMTGDATAFAPGQLLVRARPRGGGSEQVDGFRVSGCASPRWPTKARAGKEGRE